MKVVKSAFFALAVFVLLTLLNVLIINALVWSTFIFIMVFATLYSKNKEMKKIIWFYKAILILFAISFWVSIGLLFTSHALPTTFAWCLMIASFLGAFFSIFLYTAETTPASEEDPYRY